MRDISRKLYLQHGWQMPHGLMNSEERVPTNFTLTEWQKAKRLKENPKVIKALFQECWAVSDSKAAFAQALQERGYYLARGDRRGFVAFDYRAEVYSLSRYTGVKSKTLQERLGDPQDLPGVDQTKEHIAARMNETPRNHIAELAAAQKEQMSPLAARAAGITEENQARS